MKFLRKLLKACENHLNSSDRRSWGPSPIWRFQERVKLTFSLEGYLDVAALTALQDKPFKSVDTIRGHYNLIARACADGLDVLMKQ